MVPLAPRVRLLAVRDRRRDAGWLKKFFRFRFSLVQTEKRTPPHSQPSSFSYLKKNVQQTIQQQYNEPFLAIVVDPHRTAAAGRVELGAFRAYPEGYKPPPSSSSSSSKKKTSSSSASSGSGRQTIPLSKVEDFGVHADRYYAMETEIFKSSLDAGVLGALWRRYWGAALAASPMA